MKILSLFKRSAVLLAACAMAPMACGQTPVVLAESTIKVSGLGEEVFYFGFAEGDRLIFNFNEVEGKELKEIEIIELPSASRFMEYKSTKVENKVLQIQRTGIYKIRFANSNIRGRICRWKLERVAANATTQNFNSSVYWRTVSDTTYTPREERYIASVDTIATVVADQMAKVSSQGALNGNSNKSIVDFTLPVGTTTWSYYIGVGSAGKKAYDAAQEKAINKAIKFTTTIPGAEALTGLAIGINLFDKIQGSDNVKYYFISDWTNVQQFMAGQTFLQYKQGDVVTDAVRMQNPLGGKVFIGLFNDNLAMPIDVTVKVVAIQIKKVWATRMVNQMSIASRDVAYLKE